MRTTAAGTGSRLGVRGEPPLHSTGDASRLSCVASSLTYRECSLLAPCQPGASPVSVRRGVSPRTPKSMRTAAVTPSPTGGLATAAPIFPGSRPTFGRESAGHCGRMAPVMNIATLSVLSLLPIITVAVFLVVLRWPASRAMPLSYGVAIVLALAVWQVPFRAGCGGVDQRPDRHAHAALHHLRRHPAAQHAAGGRRPQDDSRGVHEHHARPPRAGDRHRLAVRVVHRGFRRVRHARRRRGAAAGGPRIPRHGGRHGRHDHPEHAGQLRRGRHADSGRRQHRLCRPIRQWREYAAAARVQPSGPISSRSSACA